MKILALDTSTEYCSAALWLDGEVCQRLEHAGQRHSQLLLPMVDALLVEAGLVLGRLDALAAAVGPGSFTGLRIATAVGQGLAFGADLPVVPVGTLDALAEGGGANDMVACIDARMNEVYIAAFRRGAQGVDAVLAPALAYPDALPDLPSGQWVGCGNGFDRFGDRMAACWPQVRIVHDRHPEARHVAALAAARFLAGERHPPEALVPLYVRDKVALSTAER
ncbi:MAG: tRNA (adenosine(37)-N6)-threonylcarbamoyltransferase complex dimerization subunit type 1 TsaB [Betaproteobacteria bacterium]